tara:strand:+ start:292 stop:483 length:192 start_codon:yes stop_codon:yes gene_type:complete
MYQSSLVSIAQRSTGASLDAFYAVNAHNVMLAHEMSLRSALAAIVDDNLTIDLRSRVAIVMAL